jgi:peptidoglycan/xylan/chitin deacetylase (PgdA/CDA1 family)
LADLPPDAVEHELKHSRSVLESWVNQDIHSLSFPGGRYTPAVMDRAKLAGYRQIFDSTFDTVSVTDLAEQKPLARVAIRRSTSADDFQRMITRDGSLYRKVQRAQWIKQTLKHTLGNRLYHGLYKSLTAHR